MLDRRHAPGPLMLLALLTPLLGCAASPAPATLPAANQPDCPTARDSAGLPLTYVVYVIDGRRMPGYERYLGGGPHSVGIRLDSIPEVTALDVGEIAALTPLRGPEAEAAYDACPGHGIILVTTKRGAADAAADSAAFM